MRKPYRISLTCFSVNGDPTKKHYFDTSFPTKRQAMETAVALSATYSMACGDKPVYRDDEASRRIAEVEIWVFKNSEDIAYFVI